MPVTFAREKSGRVRGGGKAKANSRTQSDDTSVSASGPDSYSTRYSMSICHSEPRFGAGRLLRVWHSSSARWSSPDPVRAQMA